PDHNRDPATAAETQRALEELQSNRAIRRAENYVFHGNLRRAARELSSTAAFARYDQARHYKGFGNSTSACEE
ncbi:MAG TPA: hypothetical protein VHA52_08675, partial [Candidatus Babeliaceae bacterium]|nr:hypothetical protein [Candidatus Babeliaceae bacterium]